MKNTEKPKSSKRKGAIYVIDAKWKRNISDLIYKKSDGKYIYALSKKSIHRPFETLKTNHLFYKFMSIFAVNSFFKKFYECQYTLHKYLYENTGDDLYHEEYKAITTTPFIYIFSINECIEFLEYAKKTMCMNALIFAKANYNLLNNIIEISKKSFVYRKNTNTKCMAVRLRAIKRISCATTIDINSILEFTEVLDE